MGRPGAGLEEQDGVYAKGCVHVYTSYCIYKR